MNQLLGAIHRFTAETVGDIRGAWQEARLEFPVSPILSDQRNEWRESGEVFRYLGDSLNLEEIGMRAISCSHRLRHNYLQRIERQHAFLDKLHQRVTQHIHDMQGR